MYWLIILLAVWTLLTGSLLFELFNTRRELRQWKKLEGLQAERVNHLQAELDTEKTTIELWEKFNTRPGMETVSPMYAKKYLEIESENLRLTAEVNRLRLESAKYMDLYREERYKPRQINR